VTDTADFASEVLADAADQIDVPAHLLELADEIYRDIGGYLSAILPGERDWQFYPQGSARIGTSVYPTGDDEWDVDTVAEVDVAKEDTTQAELKATVGTALRNYVRDRADDPRLGPTGVEPGRRCWTLTYGHPFHVDVLPAVPNFDDEAPTGGIWLADRDLLRWQPSNPAGYADWFISRMYSEFAERRAQIAKAASVSIDEIPTWRVKTTLQRAVQIVKLHRNAFFAGDLNNRPPSCVITTLTGLSYNGERTVVEALMNTAQLMPGRLIRSGGKIELENPAQPGDNLADRWSQSPLALARFQPWLDDLQRTLDAATRVPSDTDRLVASLASRFDEGLIRKAASRVRGVTSPAAAAVASVTERAGGGGRFGPVPPTPARSGRAG
jgi:hypothetical protein